MRFYKILQAKQCGNAEGLTAYERQFVEYLKKIDIKTITGVLPLTFTAKGGIAADWVIYGNDDNGTENLFDIDNVIENYPLVNGVPTHYEFGGYVTSDYISIASNTATISAKIIKISGIGAHWAVYDENKTFIRGGTALVASGEIGTVLAKTVNTSEAAFIRVDYGTESLTDCMLNLGSTEPDHYIPYQKGVGERTAQLFDIDNALENYYLLNGVPTQYKIGGYVLSDYISITSNTATISAKINKSSTVGAHWAVYDENKTFIRGELAFIATEEIGTALAKTVNTSEAAFIRVDYGTESLTDCMLNLGSTALPYIPYGYQIPLTVSQTGQTDKNYDIYIGDSPLTEGQQVSKTSTGQDIELFKGENVVSTTLYNKPSAEIKYK